MNLTAYIGGTPVDLSQHTNRDSAIIAMEARDGRTIQLTFSEDGHLYLRGWENRPDRVDNWNTLTFDCILALTNPINSV